MPRYYITYEQMVEGELKYFYDLLNRGDTDEIKSEINDLSGHLEHSTSILLFLKGIIKYRCLTYILDVFLDAFNGHTKVNLYNEIALYSLECKEFEAFFRYFPYSTLIKNPLELHYRLVRVLSFDSRVCNLSKRKICEFLLSFNVSDKIYDRCMLWLEENPQRY